PSVSKALVCKEEESLVAAVIQLGYDDRPSRRRAEHILSEGSLALKERIARVQGIIAQVLPNTSVQRVGAGLALNIDDSAQRPAKLGFVVVRLDFELLNAIDDRGNGIGAQEWSLVIDAVQHEEITAIALTIH